MATLAESLNAAAEMFRSGRFAEAEVIVRQALARHDRAAEAWHLLGVLSAVQSRLPEAVDHFQRAIGLDPGVGEFHRNLGHACRQLGRAADAESSYRRALAFDPDDADAAVNLAMVLDESGKADEATACVRELIGRRPHDPVAHHFLGDVLLRRGHAEEAVACFQRVVELRPGDADAANNLGLAWKALGQPRRAADCFRRALELRPGFVHALNNLGVLWKEWSQPDQAADCFRQALRAEPDRPEALSNLGAVLCQAGRPDEGIACYRRALERTPKFAQALFNLGNAYARQGQVEEAADCYGRILELGPAPPVRFARATLLPVVYRSVEHVAEARQTLVREVSSLLADGVRFDPRRDLLETTFHLAYQGGDDREIQSLLGRFWDRPPAEAPSSRHSPSAVRRASGPDRRIRVGFLSAFFCEHTIGRLWGGLMARLSRQDFQVVVFSLGAADDAVARSIREHADVYCPLPLHLPAARKLVAELRPDVLVYTDVGMHPMTTSLAACRLAPVQCATWGHPVTTGLPAIDYFLSSDLLEADGADAHYTERLVRLKTLGLYVERPDVPPAAKRRSDFGLPGDRHLYGCLQSTFKFHPAFDPLLGEILRRDPAGILAIPRGLYAHWDGLLRERLERTIPDVADRVRFLPRRTYADFLALNRLMDVLLVPPQFGGGRTSYEALALGVPLVTLPSPYLKGRITYGLYRAMGVLDAVAAGAAQYVEIALRLGTDPPYRREIREKILAANGRLFDDREAVRETEGVLAELAHAP